MSELLHWRNIDWEVKDNEILSDYIETYRAWYKVLGTWGNAADQVIILIRKNCNERFSIRSDEGLKQRISQLEKVMAGENAPFNPYDKKFHNTSPRNVWF